MLNLTSLIKAISFKKNIITLIMNKIIPVLPNVSQPFLHIIIAGITNKIAINMLGVSNKYLTFAKFIKSLVIVIKE